MFAEGGVGLATAANYLVRLARFESALAQERVSRWHARRKIAPRDAICASSRHTLIPRRRAAFNLFLMAPPLRRIVRQNESLTNH